MIKIINSLNRTCGGISDNIWKLKLFGIIHEFILVLPIITIFWIDKGLNMTDVFLLHSFF